MEIALIVVTSAIVGGWLHEKWVEYRQACADLQALQHRPRLTVINGGRPSSHVRILPAAHDQDRTS